MRAMDTTNRFYYRGEPKAGYRLLPKLVRQPLFDTLKQLHAEDNAKELQYILLRRFQRYASHLHLSGEHRYFTGGDPSQDEWLCVAQHHGLPTLLLDWTLNPLIALYFSVKQHAGIPGRIWVMQLKNKEDRGGMTVHLEDYHETGRIELSRRMSAPQVVVPCVFTRRIEAQSGRFTFSGHADPQKSLEEVSPDATPWSVLTFFEVPEGKAKEDILKELDAMRINEGTVFPDLDGVASHLANGGL